MTWIEQSIFFVDFEGNQASGVLEFGVVEVCGERLGTTQTRRCRATGRVRAEDVAVHGLTTRAVAGCAPFADEWELFAGLRERGPLAAHFAGAENALIKSVWPYPRSSPDFTRSGGQTAEWGPWVDTARIYGQLYPALGTGKLELLVAACGLQAELDAWARQHCPADRRRYHAALYDALAGALLLASLAREPRLRELSTMQLLALSTLDPRRREALRQTELF